MKSLIEAIEHENQPPCVAYACAQFKRCAEERLACDAFAYYVIRGVSVHPYSDFVPKSKGDSRVVMGEGVNPTREVFDAVEADKWKGQNSKPEKDRRKGKTIQNTNEAIEYFREGVLGRTLDNWFTMSPVRAISQIRRALKREAESEQ
jgi:hypothetical protein